MRESTMTEHMTEHRVLLLLLLVAFVLAPWMTRSLLLDGDRRYGIAHIVAVVVVVASWALDAAVGSMCWGLFCAFGLALYLSRWRRAALSLDAVTRGVAGAVPGVFSVISAVWFIAGTNDLHLLGYTRAWSFYAALHGGVLGWLFVGCVAHLAHQPEARPFYARACFAVFVLFLCVAFGIDGVPYIKRVGVVGFAALMPAVIARFALDVRGRGGAPLWWALVSLVGVVVSMALALANEFWIAFPRVLLGLPTMVITHGVLNGVVVVPAFFFAVRAHKRASSRERG
jgi:hypothetical protein